MHVLTYECVILGVCTSQECVLTRSVYWPGVYTNQESTNQECVLTRSVYWPGVCTNWECVLARIVY